MSDLQWLNNVPADIRNKIILLTIWQSRYNDLGIIAVNVCWMTDEMDMVFFAKIM